MFRILILLMAVCTFMSTAWAAPVADTPTHHLTFAQVEADVNLVKTAYSRIHPGYTRYSDQATLDAAWQNIIDRAKAESGLALGDLYLEIQSALTLIRCDHTKAELPETLRERRKTSGLYLPARIDVVERRGFVRVASPDSLLQVADEILFIDGRAFADVLTAVESYIPYDGKTEWARNAGLTESLEFMGGAIDHFGALLWHPTQRATLKIRRATGADDPEELELAVDRIDFIKWTELNELEIGEVGSTSELQTHLINDGSGRLDVPNSVAANFKDALVFRRIGNNAAYLRVDTFVNYRDPVEPAEIYGPVFKAIAEENRNTLILDLRLNGGGSTDAQRGLLEHLIQKPVRPVKDMRVATLDFDGLREHLWTWDKRALNPNRVGFRNNHDGTYSLRRFVGDEYKKAKPATSNFGGKLIALTSNSNSSGTTNLLSVLREHRPVTLVGQKTGGSVEGVTAGLLFTLTLPESQIKTRIPFFLTYNNVREFIPGFGLAPDVYVELKADEWSLDYDPVLEEALNIIR